MKITKQTLMRELREWGEAIAIAVVLVLIVRTFFFQAYKIPSGSMIPTLEIGDKLFVNKIVYRFRDPERWEIVVFKYPGQDEAHKKKDFIKRVIAKGGETVEIQGGQILINGIPTQPPPAIGSNYYSNEGAFAAAGQSVSVPENAYFVLGDNSLHSHDSRYWGFVPRESVVGKAMFRWWPPRRIGTFEE